MTLQFRIIKYSNEDLSFVEVAFIVNPKIICAVTIPQLHYLRMKTIQPDSLVLGSPKNQRLALFKEHRFLCLGAFLGEYFKSAIIKDVTVLIDLEEGSAPMLMHTNQQ